MVFTARFKFSLSLGSTNVEPIFLRWSCLGRMRFLKLKCVRVSDSEQTVFSESSNACLMCLGIQWGDVMCVYAGWDLSVWPCRSEDTIMHFTWSERCLIFWHQTQCSVFISVLALVVFVHILLTVKKKAVHSWCSIAETIFIDYYFYCPANFCNWTRTLLNIMY